MQNVAKILIFSNIERSNAGIAQLVEHSPEERGVGSANLPPSTRKIRFILYKNIRFNKTAIRLAISINPACLSDYF